MRAIKKTALILIVASVGALLLHVQYKKNQELRYEERSIHYWFTQLPATIVSSQQIVKAESITVQGKQYGSTDHVSKAYAALDHFGPKAIDYLMGKLVERDSLLEQKATEVALKLGATSFPARNSWIERGQAITGLIYLKELPPETVQTLTQLSRSSRPEVAEAAKFILRKDKRDPDIICKGFVISGNVRIP
jgi:hypothetical protein